MELNIAPEHQAIIDDQLARGRYGSADELIEDAMDELAARLERDRKREELWAYLQVGLDEADRGEVVRAAVDEIYADAAAEG